MILDRDEATLVGRTRRIQLNATASEANLHGFQNVRQYKTDSKGRWRDFPLAHFKDRNGKFHSTNEPFSRSAGSPVHREVERRF